MISVSKMPQLIMPQLIIRVLRYTGFNWRLCMKKMDAVSSFLNEVIVASFMLNCAIHTYLHIIVQCTQKFLLKGCSNLVPILFFSIISDHDRFFYPFHSQCSMDKIVVTKKKTTKRVDEIRTHDLYANILITKCIRVA